MLITNTEIVEIPRGAGTEGYVHALREILKHPRVKVIHIERGKFECTRTVEKDDPFQPLKVDFETVMPHSIIRNGEVKEVQVTPDNAAVALATLFRRASIDRLYPIAFVGSHTSNFWAWHVKTTGVDLPITDEIYGLPFYGDTHYENATLLMCTSYVRDAALIDTQRTYKILMPEHMTETP